MSATAIKRHPKHLLTITLKETRQWCHRHIFLKSLGEFIESFCFKVNFKTRLHCSGASKKATADHLVSQWNHFLFNLLSLSRSLKPISCSHVVSILFLIIDRDNQTKKWIFIFDILLLIKLIFENVYFFLPRIKIFLRCTRKKESKTYFANNFDN